MEDTLLIFIKNPVPGHVKTRLARTVGPEEALRIYRILLDKTRHAALGIALRRWVWYSNEVMPDDEWSAADFEKYAQQGPDLGARMERAFEQAFRAGARKVLIIGSDCPDIHAGILQQALDTLNEADAVLGPTPDGGYYLLGLRQFDPAFFRDIAWSTEMVLQQTLAVAKRAGLRAALLPALTDIDTEADWRAWQDSAGTIP
jgi:uncharacterized protein